MTLPSSFLSGILPRMNTAPTNPFPGMNPYLEAEWADVHPRLLIYASAQLQRELPPGLKARVEQDLLIKEAGAGREVVPDVAVWQRREEPPADSERAAVLDRPVTTEPVKVLLPPRFRRHLEITDSRGRLVTAIEIVSPSNKRGRDSASYARKRDMFIDSGVNLVEIDLARRGGLASALFDAAPFVEKAGWDTPPPYLVTVVRATEVDARELYAIRLNERLPTIRVPLRESDEDAPLDLQAMIEQCYVEGGYDDTDYSREPEPPLSSEESAWMDTLLKSKGLR